MMQKDPAVLFFIDNWLTSTAEMDSDTRGWYLNLILHNYDKGDLPADLEKLAVLAGVKFSEYGRFTTVFESTLKQKFIFNTDTGRLQNPKASDVLKSREQFKDKRTKAGNIGVIIRLAKDIKGYSKVADKLKTALYEVDVEELENYKDISLLTDLIASLSGEASSKEKFDLSFVAPEFLQVFTTWLDYKKARRESYKSEDSLQACYNKLLKDSGNNSLIASQIIENAKAANYSGFFPLKNSDNQTAKRPDRVSELLAQNQRLKRSITNE